MGINCIRKIRTFFKLLLFLIFIFLLVTNLIATVFVKVPLKDVGNQKYDVIVVLGYPAQPDGKPSPMMQQRVIEGVALYQQRSANNIIVTGGAAHNKYVEATVMAKLASSLGVTNSHIIEETEARNTYQNVLNSVQIMQKRSWKSAIIVTSPNHIKRASYLFSHYPIDYAVASSGYPANMSIIEQLLFEQWEKYALTRLVIYGGHNR